MITAASPRPDATDRQAGRQAGRQAPTDRQTAIDRHRLTDRQAGRQAGTDR